MFELNNMILIGSTDRKTGKTEFAVRLIKKFKKDYNVIGIKVTTIQDKDGKCPRGSGKECGVCTSLKGRFSITEEKKIFDKKDTGKMLIAGAEKVYWLRILYECLEKGFKTLLKKIDKDSIIICESNSLRNIVKPGLFIIIKQDKEHKIKLSCEKVIKYADRIVFFNSYENDFSILPENIYFMNNSFFIKENATAIILAGGNSSRMKKDKSFLPVKNKPLIKHIYEQLTPHFEEILIGSNDSKNFSFLNCKVVPDKIPDQGPLMGILSCLEKSKNNINFITACDIPVMNIKFIKKMIKSSVNYDIVIPVTDKDKYEPLFAVYKKSVIDNIKLLLKDGERKISSLLSKVNVKYINFKQKNWYKNLNTIEDYKEFINNDIK